MAVVQISKIQLRRGQKNSQSGIPQLSSAEMAWAIDTQELFIGNGSVAEGAPYVGNTKILTEHDNILELVSSYEFAAADPSVNFTVKRSLQNKIDEIQVSVKDFGAVGDGVTDSVAAFENAFSQLFLNVDDRYKKVLFVPNGEYQFESNLKIPSSVIIRGETQDGVVLNINHRNLTFTTADGIENLVSFSSTNRPQNVNISNVTILRSSGSIIISGLAESLFENVIFKGSYEPGSGISNLFDEKSAILFENINLGTKVENVIFKNCSFISNSISVKLKQQSVFDNSMTFKNCKFFVGYAGIYLEVPPGTKNEWTIDNCEFDEIETFAFKSLNGTDSLLLRCKFKNCGNGLNSSQFPLTPIVEFGDSRANLLIDCISDRQQSAGIVSDVITDSTVAITEVLNGGANLFINRNYANIDLSDNFLPLAIFSAKNKYFVINYFLKLGPYSRLGQLTITKSSETLSQISFTDQYQYSSPIDSDPGSSIMTSFEFRVDLLDNNQDSEIDTVLLSYRNSLSSKSDSTNDGLPGSISFDVTYGV